MISKARQKIRRALKITNFEQIGQTFYILYRTPARTVRKKLLSETALSYDSTVTVDVLRLKVAEQALTLTNHHEKTTS